MEKKKFTNKYIKTEWVRQMSAQMAMIYPTLDKSVIMDKVIEIFNKRFKDTEAMIYNDYENQVTHTSLASVVDWIQDYHPIIAESGVFFYPKDQVRNVNIEIIQENMLEARKKHKKEKFEALAAGNTFLAAIKDLQQANDKKAANSGYGAEGEHSSFLYNTHSAMSVTASGRGQISTAMQCFDNLLSDFVKFFNMEEFFTYIYHIKEEQHEWKFSTFDICKKVPSKQRWMTRYLNKFLHDSLYDYDVVERMYDALDDEMKIRTFYKGNMRDFFSDNFKPAKLFSDIIETKESFVDPNTVPESIASELKHLCKMVTEFVNYKYSYFRYEDRGKYQKRSNIIVTDTDSTFISYGPILAFMRDEVLPLKLFKTDAEAKAFKLKILSVLSNFSSYAIEDTLNNYLDYVNVAEEDKKFIKMKNEFYYERVIVTYAKKSYIGLMARQESHVYDEPKLDVKGVNFFKSTSTEATSEFIYKEILMNQLMRPKDGKISLQRTFRKIYDFQCSIANMIREGDIRFMKRSIKVKSCDAYADPMRNGACKAVIVWNYLNDETKHITLPATVTQVKVVLRNKKDIAPLSKWPEIYDRMMELFDDSDYDIGDHEINGVVVKGKGIKSIAVPVEYDVIPDWLVSIIDVETLVQDNMKLMTQLFRPLGLSAGTASHNGTSMTHYMNIVRI